ncbi:hypothetical protein TWF694_009294 [Orbilia ellipsospora]|uniref:cellulase n=1 Tax=Orbilia ellipsospora TaxID=2528407 RepID=A0AAV9XEH5_9PEZI
MLSPRLSVAAVLLVAHSALAASSVNSTSGTGATSFYWDCCKASCSWTAHGSFVGNPVQVCNINGTKISDYTLGTGCNDGDSFSCLDQIPWAVNDTFSYGFVGAEIDGFLESTWCCGCYEFVFTNGPVQGKRMVVQASNTNYDAHGYSQFNLGIPGGYDYASGCATEFGASPIFGKQNNGVLTRDQCDYLPDSLKPGCQWRFDWFLNANKPNVTWKRVPCPTELTDITGCIRSDEAEFIAKAQTNDTTSPPPSAASIVGSQSVQYTFAFAALISIFVAL